MTMLYGRKTLGHTMDVAAKERCMDSHVPHASTDGAARRRVVRLAALLNLGPDVRPHPIATSSATDTMDTVLLCTTQGGESQDAS
jgi:hypothetical protein